MPRPSIANGLSVTFTGLTNIRATSIKVSKNAKTIDTGSAVGGYKEKIAGLPGAAECTVNFICLTGYTIPLQGAEATLSGDVGAAAGYALVKSRSVKYSAGEIIGGTIVFKASKDPA